MADYMDVDVPHMGYTNANESTSEDDAMVSDGNISEISDADSDLLELQADIAKLDASVEAFAASQKGESYPGTTKVRKRAPRGRMGPRKLPKPTPDILLRLSMARKSFDQGDYETAKERLGEVITVSPETYEAWALLSTIFEEMGSRREALQCLITAAHIQPRNVNVWIHTATYALEDIETLEEGSDERNERLDIANMCYSGAIRANPSNVDARTGKADVLMMKGYASNALDQYRRALKHRPLNIRTVRNLADCTLDTRDPKQGAEAAKRAYQHIINHCQAEGTMEAEEGAFEWSDLRIYLEFFAVLEQWQEAAFELKRIARWLLGREAEFFWDQWTEDDREWDINNDRRIEVPVYMPARFPIQAYGEGLPIDLRAKLCVYRLKTGLEFESSMHLQCLDAERETAFENFQDWPDCLKEIGTTLLETGRAHSALPYFMLYRRIAEVTGDFEVDSSVLVLQGRCYMLLGNKEAAEECFIAAIDADEEDIDGRYELAKMYENEHQKDGQEEALLLVNEALNLEALREGLQEEELEKREFNRKLLASRRKVRGPYKRRTAAEKEERRLAREKNAGSGKRRFIPRRFVDEAQKRSAEATRDKEVRQMYEKLKALRPQMGPTNQTDEPNDEAIRAWQKVAGALVADFRSNRDFFPWEKYILYVTAQTEKSVPLRRTTKLTLMAERLRQNLAPSEGEPLLPPQLLKPDYRGIPFNAWLDIFLEYALTLVRDRKRRESYAVCQAARDSVVFATREDTFLIHVTWASCAVYAADEEACVAIARYFMRDYAPGADSYRLFAAMSRICQSPVSWYCSGPAQKFILRQIRLLDSFALGLVSSDKQAQTTWSGAAPIVSADTEVSEAQRKAGTGEIGIDVCLLTIYGHILFSTTSYTYALSYFARAATLDPENPMINLSYGLAYIHYALKRQATNRQYLLTQGFALLFKYYHVRLRTAASAGERQEAHFNIGRAYSLLGLGHLAVDYYQKVLDEARERPREKVGETVVGREDLVMEAAMNIRSLCFVLEDWDGVQAITEEWLVLE